MSNSLRLTMYRLTLLSLLLFVSWSSMGQSTTAFSTDFSTSAGTLYTTANGPIGSSTSWSMLRSGTDMGARINSGILSLTNDATGSYNNYGWVMAYTSAPGSPYTTTLTSNPGIVTWSFNMRQIRSNPSAMANGYYSNAFILAGTSNTTATTGTGYAVVLGQSGSIDPIRLVRYSAGVRTSTNIIASNTSGLADFGNQYLSVKVTYTPSTNSWQLYVRNDGSAFQDPSVGTLSLQGTVVNNTYTGTALPLMGAFWNTGLKSNQTAFFDNVKVAIATPALTSISPTSKVAGTGAFTLTVNGSNFINSSVVKWNGVNLTTTYVSATQLTAAVPAGNISSAGTAAITVGTGTAISNALSFTIDPAGVPSISTSISAIPAFTTITGTASAAQTFTSSGANLTGNITVTAPANFEVSLASAGTYTQSVNVTAASTPVYVRVSAGAPAGIYTGTVNLTTPGGATKQIAVNATVYNAEPTTSATLLTFTNVTSISFNINWTVGNGSNHLAVIRAGSAVNATPVDGTTYFPSTVYGAGSEIGTGNYVVYNGTANSVNVSNLNPATTYHVAIYEFNGTAGTENYRTATPAIGNRTTLNAPVGLQVTAANTQYKVDFDTTVEGVNNGVYAGGGLGVSPDDGELNSNTFAFTPLTTGGVTFGSETTEDDAAFGNGASEGGVTEPGLYAFETSPDNFGLGIQPGGDYASGSTTMRFQNQTGAAVTSLSVGYKVYVYNDEAGSNSYNFSHSANNSTYTPATVLDLTSPAAADGAPQWKAYYKVITLTGLNIAANGYYYLRWSGSPVSGTAYDEIALDDISIVANPTTTFASFAGTAETFVLAGNANLAGDVTVNGDITFNNGKAIIGANTLTLKGTVTNTVTGGLRGSATSNLVINGAVSPTLSFDQTTVGTTNMLNNFSVATTAANTVTLANSITVSGTLNTNEFQTLNLGTNTITGALSTITNNGNVTTQNTTTTPFASGKIWGGVGTVTFNAATTAQYLPTGTYNKVTVSTTGGVTATGNVTLTGDLNLPNANPSATKGSFDTSTFTLTMGPLAQNIGTGDVSGTVARTTILPNVDYTFGHPVTKILFPNVGTLPVSLGLRTVLGSAPAGKPDSILRTYNFIQSGGSGTKAIISAHYLDSELNGNTENKLVDWIVIPSPVTLIEQGRTNYSVSQNYVELANVNVSAFASTYGSMLLTLANSQVVGSTWNGSVSDSWTTAANWTPAATPSDATNVIIPDAATTPNDPILNPSVTIGTLSIENGGILNSPTGSQFIITGANGAWINKGTFNPSNGTVTFNSPAATAGDATIAGNYTTFYNLNVPTGTTLRALTNNVMDIAGTFTKTGSFIVGSVHNTVIYSGTNQTIVVPNGGQTAYHGLTISGTGAILPASLNILAELTTNAAVNFAGTTVTILGSEGENPTISGTVSPTFNNLTINEATTANVLLGTNIAVSGTLTLTSGILDIGNYNLTLGVNPVAGTFSDTTMIEAEDNGVVRRPYTGPGSYSFPIGEGFSNTTYSPITVNITAASSFNNGYISVNLRDAVHPNNYSTGSYLTRYWNVTPTGITNPIVSITANYRIGDAVGGESNLVAAQLNGTFNVLTNPWVKFGTLGSTTLTANALLTDGKTSVFTGLKATTPVVEIIGEGSFCQNTPVTLTTTVTGGDAPYIYQWSGGLGSADTATPPTTTPGTTNYTLTVIDANGITSTDTAQIIVTPTVVAGTATGDQVLCANTTPGDVTLTGYTGNIIRWERANTPDFVGATIINVTNPVLTGTQIGTGITSTKYIRAVIQSGSCDAVYSNTVVITVNSTTWNGTAWSNGVPTDGYTAIFSGNFTATADIYACAVIVNSNAVVVIPTGFNAIITNSVRILSGSFNIENNASLVQINNISNSGDVIVKKNSNPLFRLDYTMWSSPVTGQPLNTFSPFTATNRFYTYGGFDSNNVYQDQYFVVPDLTATFQRATGYLIRMPNSINGTATGTYYNGTATHSFVGIFKGVANNGSVTKALNTSGGRYTATGNPYPSPINLADFFTENAGVLDSGSGLYFWRKKNDSNVSTYATLTLAGLVANGATPDPTPENPNPSPDSNYQYGGQTQEAFYTGNNQNWIVSQGQGFLVRAAANLGNPQLRFTNVMRRKSPANGLQPFFKGMQNGQDDASRLWLNITGTSSFSQVAVAYIAGATLGLDYGYDGKRLTDGGNAQLYTMVDDTNLAIQARPAFNAADVVPLGFTATAPGQFTFAIDHVDGVFAQGQEIYLVDHLTGVTHDIKGSAYTFSTESGTFNDRFSIVYMKTTLGVNNPDLIANGVIIYKESKQIKITSGGIDMTDVTIFDLTGRNIYNEDNVNITTFTSDALNIAQQVIIVTVKLQNGQTVSKKVLFD
ncbi:T9SS sorting signal type C domain-containing protein [Flavobacterium zepuense]|uniref:T9SS sorting signal type C domain-containing protein n=1 Tax=Flavobacterium zepuense TaxID=2593302 RepID=A0A552UVX3_9FLAO|nr:T9SS sorting signal type C domain-containing protein [Flavobacterium zepuense]TRW22359.1 T9SS sorting signal type C domain-containing protein [Flavobacterium zepuense]